jgi:hypothetical protein
MVRPSHSGWWVCCQCRREVNPRLWGDDCPDCLHRNSEFLSTTVLTPIVRRPRDKKQELHLYLNDYLMANVCADTGSPVNCMWATFAAKIGVTITPSFQEFRLAIKGHRLTACGTAQVDCRFPNPPYMPRTWQFYIFDVLATDVICGLGFLRATQTLEHYPNRLHAI